MTSVKRSETRQMPVAKLTARLCLLAAVACTALVGLAVLAGNMLLYGDEIAFVSDRDGDQDIYIMDLTTALVYNLTTNSVNEYRPMWSPDGSQIVFAATYLEYSDHWVEHMKDSIGRTDTSTYLIDMNGENMHSLSVPYEFQSVPTWSPDGRQITFLTPSNKPILYTMDTRGENQRPLGQVNRNSPILSHAWSSDGQRIAYSSNADGRWSIFILEPATNVEYRLPIEDDLVQYGVSWSPDNSRILFMSNFGADPTASISDIYVVEVETGNYEALTDGTSFNGYAVWSPNGEHFVFTSWRDGNAEIYMMNADGSNERRLTYHPSHDMTPAWRPHP
jgi:TolB protein